MSVSIRHKINLFVCLIAFTVIALCVFLLGTLYLHMGDFNNILGDSYKVHYSLVCFEGENTAFIALTQSTSEENLALYQNAKKQTGEAFAQLIPDYRKHSLNRYLVTQAIRNAYAYYSGECELLLRLDERDIAYANRYYDTLDTAEYIGGYFQQLMKETLDEGTANYAKKLGAMRVLPVVGVLLSLLVLFFAAFLWSMVMRHIIRPVLQMANSAERIAENELEIPDIHVENRDEIGRLVLIFNRMKDSMRKYILTLQKVNEMTTRLHQEELKKVEMGQQLKAMQLSMLQSQINPHFLFNTLGTIRSTAKIENARYTEELIQRLANMFRYNLQTSDAIVELEREMSIIEDYIYIQRRRFGFRLRFVTDCRMEDGAVFVPAFTLQPLVENAVIHGVSPKEEGGSIRVRIFRRGGFVHIHVTDTGLGIPPGKLTGLMDQTAPPRGHLSHIGIGNVKSRLGLLFAGSSLRVHSRVGLGTSVRLAIPVEKGVWGNV